MGNQVRVCSAACQDPDFIPTEIRSRMSCILAQDQIYLSGYGWLLIANTVRISYRRGAFY